MGGHRELIPESLRPYTFASGNAVALAKAVLQLLSDRESWPALVSAGRRYVAEQRTWRQSASEYRRVYLNVAPHK